MKYSIQSIACCCPSGLPHEHCGRPLAAVHVRMTRDPDLSTSLKTMAIASRTVESGPFQAYPGAGVFLRC